MTFSQIDKEINKVFQRTILTCILSVLAIGLSTLQPIHVADKLFVLFVMALLFHIGAWTGLKRIKTIKGAPEK